MPALLTTVEPPAFLLNRATAYFTIRREVAARHAALVAPFSPAGVLGHRDIVLADRVHPNGRAITAVVNGLLPIVEGMLVTRNEGAR